MFDTSDISKYALYAAVLALVGVLVWYAIKAMSSKDKYEEEAEEYEDEEEEYEDEAEEYEDEEEEYEDEEEEYEDEDEAEAYEDDSYDEAAAM